MPIIILKQKKGLSRNQKRRIVQEFTRMPVNVTGIERNRVPAISNTPSPKRSGQAINSAEPGFKLFT